MRQGVARGRQGNKAGPLRGVWTGTPVLHGGGPSGTPVRVEQVASSARRYRQLDGLRGVAALIVALAHYVFAFQPALALGAFQPPGPALWRGALAVARSPLVVLFSPELGVAIFFVLSGFVLASSVTAKPAPLPELAVRRWIRLSGPILLTSLPVWLWLTTGFHPDLALAAVSKSGWLGGMYAWVGGVPNALHVLVFQSLFDLYARGHGWWNAALWTMPIEFWGSLGLFAAYAIAARVFPVRVDGVGAWRAHGVRLLAALALFAVLWNRHTMLFAAGAAMFEASALRTHAGLGRQVGLRALAARPAGPALLVAGLFLAASPYYTDGWAPWAAFHRVAAHISPEGSGLLLRRAGAVLLVGAALCEPVLSRILQGRACQFLGRVSFMMYLAHVPLICAVMSFVILRVSAATGYGPATAIALPVYLAVLFGIAELATRLIDAPCIRLAHAAGAAVGVRVGQLGKVWRGGTERTIGWGRSAIPPKPSAEN